MRWFRLLGIFVGLALLASCNAEPDMLQVTGNVTLDGSPLAEGQIMFVPSDPNFGAEASSIANGTYQIKARKGQNRVEVRATRVVPGAVGPMGEAVHESIIPQRYNAQSELKADVAPTSTKHDFTLNSD